MSINLENELLEGLPSYPNGKVSVVLYNSGEGLNDNRQIDNPLDTGVFTDGEVLSGDDFRDRILTIEGRGRFQYNPTGAVSYAYYHNGRMVHAEYSHNTIHTSFIDGYSKNDSNPVMLRVVTETNRETFIKYIKGLSKYGLKELSCRNLENNIFAEFQGEGRLIECEFYGNTGKAIFIDDRASVSLSDFGYKATGTGTEIYQFGINHRRMVSGFSCDCGMCYIIKLCDNSLIMVDGGELEQITHRTTEGLWNLMCRITNKKPGEKIRIAAWLCTHAHDDHMDMFTHIIGVYHDEIALERVMFNFPDTNQIFLMPQTYAMINRICTLYPNVLYRKLHTGDSFQLANANIHVMLTHESGFELDGPALRGMNDTSTILKIEFEGHSFELLGDVDSTAESVVLSYLSSASLHADVIQAAHHVFNYLEKLYDVIDADYCFVPQNKDVQTNGNARKFAQISRTVPLDHFFFAGSGTDGLRVENNQIVHHFNEPLIVDLYDGTAL